MMRALLTGLVMLAAAGPARAAGDTDTCRNSTAEPATRLVACESVIADETITGTSRAAAFWFRGDNLMKKRDYDGAIAAFTASHTTTTGPASRVCSSCTTPRWPITPKR